MNQPDAHVALQALLDALDRNYHSPQVIAAAVRAWSDGRDCPDDPEVAALWQALQQAGEAIEWVPGAGARKLQ